MSRRREYAGRSGEVLALIARLTEESWWEWDVENDKVYLSEQWYRLLGRPPESIVIDTSTWLEAFAEEDREEIWKRLVSLRDSVDDELLVEVRLADDCACRWAMLKASATRVTSDQLPLVAGVLADRSKAKRVREMKLELKRSEIHYRSLIEQGSELIATFDARGSVTYVSPAVRKVLGKRPEEMLGASIYEHISSEYHESLRAAIVDGPNSPARTPLVELGFFHNSGSLRLLDCLLSFLYDDTGVCGIILNARDITEKRENEERLRRSEERYAIAARGTNDGLWDWNLQEDKIYLSPRWKEMLGYEETEIGDRPGDWLELVHPDDLERLESNINQHLAGGSPHLKVEYRARRKDGFYLWVLCRGLVSFDADRKPLRLAGAQTDVSQRRRFEEQLRREALYDSLTGLPNRSLFRDRLANAFERARVEQDYHFAVLFLDVDHFKIINDSMGHDAGDELLVLVAQRLGTLFRQGDIICRASSERVEPDESRAEQPNDLIARLGGDEFIVLLEDVKSKQNAVHVAERILAQLKEPFVLSTAEVFVSVSIGIAWGSRDYNLAEDVLRDADSAMYGAKAHGRGCYRVFDKSMHTDAVVALRLESGLRRGLDRDEFDVFYQPIIDVASGRICRCEALVRWNHPDRGLVLPDAFVAAAERNRLIWPIGQQVVEKAFAQKKLWDEMGFSDINLALNISLIQLLDPSLARLIEKSGAKHEIAVDRIELEITESCTVEEARIARTLAALKALGISLALDDFGTGYSSLGYIRKFGVRTIKIDKSFIGDISMDQDDEAIVCAIIAMSRQLKVRVVAEGVETARQYEFLRAQGCDEVQGFLFSPPLPAVEATALLEQQTKGHLLVPRKKQDESV